MQKLIDSASEGLHRFSSNRSGSLQQSPPFLDYICSFTHRGAPGVVVEGQMHDEK